MSRTPFEYTRGATEAELRELAAEISPMETAGLRRAEPANQDTWATGNGLSPHNLAELLVVLGRISRTYAVRIGGRLCGVCFVEEFDDRREMSFTKTRYLTEERRVTFARGIAGLLRDLAELEGGAGHGGKPMYMHVPEGDVRSEEWFVRAGCRRTERGLQCPGAEGKEA